MTRRIYVAGPYDAPTAEARAANVIAADEMARELAESGHMVFCPHTMMRGWDDIDRAVIMQNCLSFLRRWADTLLLLDGAEGSSGCAQETATAREQGLAIIRQDGDAADAIARRLETLDSDGEIGG